MTHLSTHGAEQGGGIPRDKSGDYWEIGFPSSNGNDIHAQIEH